MEDAKAEDKRWTQQLKRQLSIRPLTSRPSSSRTMWEHDERRMQIYEIYEIHEIHQNDQIKLANKVDIIWQ